jgi:hypothetical protein
MWHWERDLSALLDLPEEMALVTRCGQSTICQVRPDFKNNKGDGTWIAGNSPKSWEQP